jgi:hypothetical protein
MHMTPSKENVTILETLKQSINGEILSDKCLDAKAKAVKSHTGSSMDPIAQQLAHHYYTMKAAYYSKRLTSYAVDSPKRAEFWGRVRACCEESGTTPELYIRAQFKYFHSVFGTVPTLPQLITELAVDRARSNEQDGGRRIVASSMETKTDLGVIFSRCNQQVQEVCRVRKISREDYYRQFVVSGLIQMNKQFLESDPAYQRACDSHE